MSIDINESTFIYAYKEIFYNGKKTPKLMLWSLLFTAELFYFVLQKWYVKFDAQYDCPVLLSIPDKLA